jgi:hypothetical protein
MRREQNDSCRKFSPDSHITHSVHFVFPWNAVFGFLAEQILETIQHSQAEYALIP